MGVGSPILGKAQWELEAQIATAQTKKMAGTKNHGLLDLAGNLFVVFILFRAPNRDEDDGEERDKHRER